VALALFIAPVAQASSLWVVLSTNGDKSDPGGAINLTAGSSVTLELYYDDQDDAGANTEVFGVDVSIASTGTTTMTAPTGGISSLPAGGSQNWSFLDNGSLSSDLAFLLATVDVTVGGAGDTISLTMNEATISNDPFVTSMGPVVVANVVPEPTTALLLALGLAGLTAVGRKRNV